VDFLVLLVARLFPELTASATEREQRDLGSRPPGQVDSLS